MFKIANVEAIIIIIMMIIYMVKVSISTSAILIVLFFIISVGIGLRKVPDKYQEEPPKGRYDDYRKNKAYLRWMEENGYEFDKNMHVKKRKGK